MQANLGSLAASGTGLCLHQNPPFVASDQFDRTITDCRNEPELNGWLLRDFRPSLCQTADNAVIRAKHSNSRSTFGSCRSTYW